ncbi:MAG TPA: hypothetical protein VNN17_06145 [Terriglobia bacterium]|nr:hypothetical protein [Terriglobia bacterium]
MNPALLLAIAAGLALVSAPPASPQSDAAASRLPTITFIKEFPGSKPDYYAIELRRDGAAWIRFAPGEKPAAFMVSRESAEQIFALGEKLNRFQNVELESRRKVAHMGRKILRFTEGTAQFEAAYNHTENPDAVALTTLFERLSATQQHRDHIEYLLRFDRLGMVKELLQLEMDLEQGRLLEAALLLPVLEKVRDNRDLVNVAQQRAAGIIAKIQAAGN